MAFPAHCLAWVALPWRARRGFFRHIEPMRLPRGPKKACDKGNRTLCPAEKLVCPGRNSLVCELAICPGDAVARREGMQGEDLRGT